MSASVPIVNIEKLVGQENYATWKCAVKNYLEHEELWEPITPDTGYVEDKKKDTKARSNIILLVDPINYVHVQDATTAKQVELAGITTIGSLTTECPYTHTTTPPITSIKVPDGKTVTVQ